MANELTDLDLGEWSICIDPANEDSTIEIVKSKSGLAPVLKETDMSDANTELNDDGADDAELNQIVDEAMDELEALPDEDKGDAIAGLIAHNIMLEGAVEDATEVVKSLTENTVPKAQHEAVLKTLKQAGDVIEKMKTGAKISDDDDTLSRITKSLAAQVGGEDNIPADVRETLTDLVKSKDAAELKESIAKAKDYGFGKPEDVAGLETRIRKGRTTAADADLFASLVKQAGQIAKASPLFKSVGEDAGNLDANDPIAKAKVGADEIRKANPSLTPQQAQAKYWDENPAEYAAYRAGQRAA